MYTEGTTTEQDVEIVAMRYVCDLFERNLHLSQGPAVTDASQEVVERIAARHIPAKGRPLKDVAAELEHDVVAYGANNDHARFMGFVPGPTTAVSWLGSVITEGYNRHAGSISNYPSACAAEREVIRWLCEKAGFPAETSGGIFVSGGSIALLTAAVAARDSKLAPEDWGRGVAYVSKQTHASGARGLHIAGIAPQNIRVIPCDDAWRMCTDELERAIAQDRERGLKPFMVMATAGTTNTGAVDPLPQIADICEAENLWMHVDGAFGGSVLLTKYAGLLQGVECADSIGWDAHKWLFQTYSCAMLLVRDEATLFQSFSMHPEYLADQSTAAGVYNPFDLSPELTRPARGLKLWFTLQVMGEEGIAEAVEHGFDLARWAEDEVRNTADAEVVASAQLAMMSFRFAPQGLSEAERDKLNEYASQRMVQSGYAGVYTTELKGHKVLRICAIHPKTTEAEMRETVRRLAGYAQEWMAK